MIDVIVIGGGPAGMMASISAAENGAKVLLVEKGNQLGKKLAVTGGGRCNVTNNAQIEGLIKNIPGNGRFLYGALSQFDNQSIVEFFNKNGVKLKEEDNGRMFPESDKSRDIIDAMSNRFIRLGGKISGNTPVGKLLIEDEKVVGIVTKDGEEVRAKAVIVATGGKSVPETGSTGDGYKWASRVGHTITDLYPTEVPLTSKENFIESGALQGLSLSDVGVSVYNKKGKAIITHQMDMIFTHFGISGPAALRCSQFVVKELKKTGARSVTVGIDAKPTGNNEQVFQTIIKIAKDHVNKSVKKGFKNYLPERYLLFLLDRAGIDTEKLCGDISHDKWRAFAGLVKKFEIQISGTLSIEKAFVTGGGVSVKEVEPKTMQSKLVENLFFCGEILDVHGYTGGYNITAAMVTGHVAGKHAAENVKG